jgi:PAS domain S-box-containing protein
MFGYALSELIGQNVKILMPPPFHEAHDGYLSRYSQTGETRIIGTGREVQARRKNGTVFPIDLAVSEVEPEKIFTGIIRDLYKRKILEESLRHADRKALIGTVASGLGHDLGNMLLVFRANTNVLAANSPSPQGAAAVQSLRNVTGNLRDLANGLRLVALDPLNRGDGTSLTTCLSDWSRATSALLKTVSRLGVAVEFRIAPGLPNVAIPPHQLTQIVFNLVGNAINAIGDVPRGGGAMVRVSAEPRPGENGVRLQVFDDLAASIWKYF